MEDGSAPLDSARSRRSLGPPGRFLDEGEIGAGASGSVRRAYDPALDRVVAAKVLAANLAGKPSFLGRFVEEARVMARLEHPNIVPVHELLLDDKTAYIVMKLVRGRTLEEMVTDLHTRGQNDAELHRLLGVFLKVCDALAFAHSRGVIHCDLKPANIMVGDFGEVYLMDWGIASQRPRGATTSSSAPASTLAPAEAAPRSGFRRSTRGTPSFMAPEQARGESDALDERTDIFGLGAVFYFILTGKPPFDANTTAKAIALARASRCADVEEAAAIPPPPGLCRLVRRAMAPSAKDRFASVGELRACLDEVSRGDWSLPTRVFPAGTVIMREGDWADAAYLLIRGRCLVSKASEGVKKALRTLEAGAAFGETGVLSGDRRTATVEAMTEVTVKVVTRELIHGELGDGTWLGKFVLTLADRFRELDGRGTGPFDGK